jgi:hypothetical protein
MRGMDPATDAITRLEHANRKSGAARSRVAASPAMPAPITTTSNSSPSGIRLRCSTVMRSCLLRGVQ